MRQVRGHGTCSGCYVLQDAERGMLCFECWHKKILRTERRRIGQVIGWAQDVVDGFQRLLASLGN